MICMRFSFNLIIITKDETDEEFKSHMEKQLKEVNDDKEMLAVEHSISLNTPTSKDSTSRRDSTVCEVVMSIDNISL